MKIKIPRNAAAEIGCSEVMITKINAGQRRPSVNLALKIVRAMAARGIEIRVEDLRPDLAAVFAAGKENAA